MNAADAMREALVTLDAALARRVWAFVSPHLPQPKDDAEVVATLHVARTAAKNVPLRLRAWSHRWLSERNLPSQLPDNLKPAAERIYPVVVTSVGISVNSKYPEVVRCVRGAMEDAVKDCYALGDEDPGIVHRKMMSARQRELRGLGLRASTT